MRSTSANPPTATASTSPRSPTGGPSRGDLDDLTGDTLDTAIRAAIGKPADDDTRTPAKRRERRARPDQPILPRPRRPPRRRRRSTPRQRRDPVGSRRERCHERPRTPNLYGPSLSPAQLAEILCDCKLGRIVFGPDSLPLDVGREHRTAPASHPPRRRRPRPGLPVPRLRPKTGLVQSPSRRPVGPRRRDQRHQLRPALPVPPRRRPPTRLDQHLRRHHLHRHQTQPRTNRQHVTNDTAVAHAARLRRWGERRGGFAANAGVVGLTVRRAPDAVDDQTRGAAP